MQLPAVFQSIHPQPRTTVFPGLGIAVLLAVTAHYLSQVAAMQGAVNIPVSPIMLAILLGVAIRNLAGLPESFAPGLHFALNRVLRLGVALLGIRLSLSAVGEIGIECVPIVIGCIATALIVVNLMSRWLGLSASLATLIAVGTSICGCTAILTTAPAIRARQTEICYAVTCVVFFGTVGMLAYPFVAQWLFPDRPLAAGMFLGTAIHDTAQVVGAGLLFEQYFGSGVGMEAATVTKLVRNLSMVVVIPALTLVFARLNCQAGERVNWKKLVPLFIIGFIAMSLLRTVGDLGDAAFGFIPAAAWQDGVGLTQQAAEIFLTIAMAAVGLSTSFAGLRQIGIKPLAMGFTAAALVGLTSLVLIGLFL